MTTLPLISGLQTLDYYVWGKVERITNKTVRNNKSELRKKICQVLQDLSPDIIKCAGFLFQGRSEAAINAEGKVPSMKYYFPLVPEIFSKYLK